MDSALYFVGLMRRELHKAELCQKSERERAEGEGVFFGASKACEKKIRRPV